MRRNGEVLNKPQSRLLVFSREDGDFIDFTVQAVSNRKDFDRLCPEPTAPIEISRDGERSPMKTPLYAKQMDEYDAKFRAWLIIESISKGTPWLEWDKVDLNNPATWCLWEEEMEGAGISYGERIQIVNAVYEVNALTRNSIDQAMKAFLAITRLAQRQQATLGAEQPSTQSSAPVSDSE